MGSGASHSASDGGLIHGTRFRIERTLGEGSMGAVYLVHDEVRRERVALKTLRRVDASGIYRFKREFRALADVSHENLVQLHELFSEGTEWFFTMEFVDGHDFLTHVLGDASKLQTARSTRELRRGAGSGIEVLFASPNRDPERLRDVLGQICRGLMAVHAAGKLHRDLKPDNVLITEQGRAVVLDFGIASELTDDPHGTLDGAVFGTPAYMSPEQAMGRDVDESTDWYALGVMLFEALTGQVPFDGSYLQVLRQKQEADAPAPSALVSGVPKDLDVLCVALLSRDPADRPSGDDILQALSRAESRRSSTPSERPRIRESSPPPFLGRGEQLKELSRAVQATDDGAPITVLVSGDAGMGKSALVERFCDELTRDGRAVVLKGRCYEHEVVPFKALDSVVDSLSRYLGTLPPAEAAEVMPRRVQALARVFPVLNRVEAISRAERRGRPPRDAQQLRARASAGLSELLARIAMRRPLVLYIDDLQWGDVDSAELLLDILGGAERPALLLVCTYRSADVDGSPCLQVLMSSLAQSVTADVRHLVVEPLSTEQSIDLANHLLGGAKRPDLEALAQEARGNPHLLTELVEHLGDEGERRASRVSLQGAMTERLERLSDDARTLLQLVCVHGRPLRDDLLAKVVGDALNLGNALTELRRERLVRGVGVQGARAVEVYHDQIRPAVLVRMAPGQVRGWHRRLADALEQAGSAELEALSDHLIGAEDFARAGIYAIRAAAQAREALAFDKAASLYERALRHHADEAWRNELMVRRAEALLQAGRVTEAADTYLEASGNIPEPEAAELVRRAGFELLLAGHWRRGMDVLAPSLSAMGIEIQFDRDKALKETLKRYQQLQERGFALNRATAPIPKPRSDQLDFTWDVCRVLLAAHPMLCQALIVRYLQEALEVGDMERALLAACPFCIVVDVPLGNPQGQKPAALQLAESLSAEVDSPFARGWLAMARGFTFAYGGLLKPALMHLEQAEEIFRRRCPEAVAEVRICLQMIARLFVMLGQLENHRVLERWLREAEQAGDLLGATRFRLISVYYALAHDDLEHARERAAPIEPGLRALEHDLTGLLKLLSDLQIAMYEGDARACSDLIPQLDAASHSPLYVIRLWRTDDLLARARIRLAAHAGGVLDDEALDEVAGMLDQLAAVALESASDHERMLRAALAIRRGDRDGAIASLDVILSDAEQVGDGPILLACARLRKGELIGGADGDRLINAGVDALRAMGVRAPLQFARLYAPGFDAR